MKFLPVIFLSIWSAIGADTYRAGVDGGIPTIPVGIIAANAPYNVSSAASAAANYSGIVAAIAACPANQAVLLPSGRLETSSQILITTSVVLRGAGATNTILSCNDTDGAHFGAIYLKGAGGGANYTVSSGATQGSTNLVLSSVAGLTIGDYFTISHDGTNDPTYVKGTIPSQTIGYQGQMLKIYNISGTTVTIDQPLYEGFSSTYSLRLQKGNYLTNAGIENMTITMPGTLPQVVFTWLTANCWMSGIETSNSYAIHLGIERSMRMQVQNSTMHFQRSGPSPAYNSVYGVSFADISTGCLFVNNIVDGVSGAMLVQNGAVGNVIIYNYNPRGFGKEVPDTTLSFSLLAHGGHPNHNLFEGNYAPRAAADGYWGSNYKNTWYRNRVTRYSLNPSGTPKDNELYAMQLDTYSYSNSIVGNVFCRTNDIGETFTANKNVYQWGHDGSNTSPSPSIDTTVTNTTTLDGNFDYPANTTHWATSRHTLADSLFYTSKPSFFGSLPWPPYGPSITDAVPIIYTLPAENRYNGLTDNDVLTPDRRVDWSPGVRGGIPNYAIGATLSADTNGVTDATSAINAAITALTPGTALYIPPGTYRFNSAITINKNRVVLRGAGSPTTTLKMYATGGLAHFFVTGSSGTTSLMTGSDIARGTTNFPVVSAAGFTVGDFVELTQENDSAVIKGNLPDPTIDYQKQMLHLLGKSGNTLQFDRPIFYNYAIAQAPYAKSHTAVTNVGFEDMQIVNVNNAGNDWNIYLFRASDCWVRGVESTNVHWGSIAMDLHSHCEVRSNYFHHAVTYGQGGYGMSIGPGSDSLIEDNIGYYLRHTFVIQDGSAGNVIAYNFSERMFDVAEPATGSTGANTGTDYLMPDIEFHGGHPSMNLVEGNYCNKIAGDNFWGSGRNNTYFRNYVDRQSQGTLKTIAFALYPVDFGRYNYYYNLIGNILGSVGDTGTIYDFGTDSESGTPNGFDAATEATLLNEGNVIRVTGLTNWSGSALTLSNSYYLTASRMVSGKPDFWASRLAYPSIGPDVSMASETNFIPAKLRFYGEDYDDPLLGGSGSGVYSHRRGKMGGHLKIRR